MKIHYKIHWKIPYKSHIKKR